MSDDIDRLIEVTVPHGGTVFSYEEVRSVVRACRSQIFRELSEYLTLEEIQAIAGEGS